MSICWNTNETKTWKAQRILSHLLLSFVLVSTIAGSVYISDANSGKYGITWKGAKKIGITAWTSLPLLVNIVLGYVAITKKDRLYLSIKLGFDVFQILGQIVKIAIFGLLFVTSLGHCARQNPTSDSRHSPAADDFGDIVCSTETIDRVRLEYAMIVIVLIMEILILFDMLAACILYCIECGRNCNAEYRTEIPQEHVFVQLDQNVENKMESKVSPVY